MPTHVVENDPADERGTLLAFLDAQRGGVRRAVLGLTEEQAALKPSASALSLGGLLKHTLHAEHGWMAMARGGGPAPSFEEAMKQFEQSFTLTEDETVPGLLAEWDELAADLEGFIRALPTLEQTFELPAAPWFPKDNTSVSMRWLLLHLIEEVARHAGHADVIRESLDGKTAFELVEEAEG
ncbi:DinB family protein [Streptomyces sp. UNOC14_S4]|uniref:DinB family protein n=1 Tax=Streptomyces sp. UNOC14_S4 TaxID=2872340 RepID=UPI001E304AC5|nr:DinB family protein [Streptomyces sp. UNOC14_S4]MCC3770045.1 DinB family protein [Streptomyces sp. UNOC14_S4]